LEVLRGYIRELEKEVRSLRSQLKQFEKYERTSQTYREADVEDEKLEQSQPLTKDCESCGKGKVVETLEILGKVYGTCNVCGQNDRIK
jgi:hypothetical protein